MLEWRAVNRVRSRYVMVVAPLALVGLLLATLPARGASAPRTVTVSVPATTMWTSTSVKLAAGESASIHATGTISYGSGWPACRGIPITADGCAAEPSVPVAGGGGGLIARVGAGKPYFVGSSGTAAGPGRLALGINDWDGAFGDNSGAFTVTVTRTSTALPALPPAAAPNARPIDARSTKSNATNYSGVTVTRDGQRYRMTAHSTLQPGDVISTDDETVLTLEFAIGGRTALGHNASIRIVGDRGVEALGGTTLATPSSKLDHPLEIQTNGGILGIRD
jgi:PA-IL-like protein